MTWAIRIFGTLQLSYDGRFSSGRLSRRSKALIAFLALRYGRSVRREEIVNVLWGADYDKCHQKRLSTLLWRLNHGHDSDGRVIRQGMLRVDCNGDIRIEPDSCTWIDLAAFENVFRAIPIDLANLSTYDVSLIEKSVDLYRGDILQDMDVEWAVEVRNHARQRYLDMLQMLIEHFGRQRALDKVIAYADRYLQVDPYVEHIHVVLMNAYQAGGRRALAVASAEACRRVIVGDLGVTLSPEAESVVTTLLRARSGNPQGTTRLVKDLLLQDNDVGRLRTSLRELLLACATVLSELGSPRPSGH